MAQATIIVKNVTLSDIFIDDLGITIAASGSPGSSITLSDLYTTFEIVESTDLQSEVATGDIVINDGTDDLSVSEGLNHLKIETELEDIDQDASISGANFDDILLTGGCYRGSNFCPDRAVEIIATRAGSLVLQGGCD